MTDLRKICKDYHNLCDRLFDNNDSCDMCAKLKSKSINTEFMDKVLIAANMDAKAYLSIMCSLPQTIQFRMEVAQMILKTTDRVKLETLKEQFEYANRQICKIIGI